MASWCNLAFASKSSNPLYVGANLYIGNDTDPIVGLTIPNDVTTISKYAFSGSKLTSVTIPYALNQIGIESFSNCAQLSSISISGSIASIKDSAFFACSALTSVRVADLATWCNIAFSNALSNPLNCTSTTNLYLGSDTNPTTDLEITSGITSIGAYAFYSYSPMTSVTFPSTVTSVGDSAFANCSGLASVKVPDLKAWCEINFESSIANPLSLAHHLYKNDTEVKYLLIPSNTISIGAYAFYGCSSLDSVAIPKAVASIGDSAFYGCSSVQSVNSKIEEPFNLTAFDNIKANATLYVPFDTPSLYAAKSGWDFYEIIEQSTSDSVVISSLGYATFCSDKELDYSTDSGLEAYIATAYNKTTKTLTVTKYDKVPAGQGVLLKGTEGKHFMYTTRDAITLVNMFVGTTVPITLTSTSGGNTNLVLGEIEGSLGFYTFEGGELAAKKAYLPIPTSFIASAKKIIVNFKDPEGMTTDIKTIELNKNMEELIYNLQGQRVQNPEHGIFIVNGKKTYIK